jgi:hypothetical protein
MSIQKGLLRPVLSLAIVAVAALASWVASAPASAAEPTYISVVRVHGTVTDVPESVDFKGFARVSSRLAPDPDFGVPRLILYFDLSDVTGVGSSTRKKYLVPTPEVVQRRMAANHTFEVAFPYVQADGDPLDARTALVSIWITVNDAGAITSGDFSILTPNF